MADAARGSGLGSADAIARASRACDTPPGERPDAGNGRVTLYFKNGTSAQRTFPLLARSRRYVNVSTDFPAAAGRRFGAVIESLGSPAAQIVVERAMYTSPGGVVWAAGTNALASRIQ